MEIQTLNSNSIIKIELPNIDKKSADKIQNCFIRLLDSKFFDMKTGKIILHFSEGELREVWLEEKVWKAPALDKPS